MSEPKTTEFSSFAPDLAQLRAWLEKMIASMRFVELVVMIVQLISRMRDMNTELRKQLVNMRRVS